MVIPRYELESNSDLTVFEFISVGKNGDILKVIQYTKTNMANVYNLGFGDKNVESGEIDDKVVSDNGDGKKVLATVASTVYAFTDRYPEAMIYATGSTKSRTRLYRIGITSNLFEIQEDFEVYGLMNDGWKGFERGVEYQAFLVRRRS